jgi:hypothetical protein
MIFEPHGFFGCDPDVDESIDTPAHAEPCRTLARRQEPAQ